MENFSDCKLVDINYSCGTSSHPRQFRKIDESLIADQKEPDITRYAHVAVRMNNHMIVFGGLTKNNDVDESAAAITFMSLNVIWLYDIDQKTWRKSVIHAKSSPTRRYLATAAAFRSEVYLFGGYKQFHPPVTNELWKLVKTGDTSFTWSEISTTKSASPSPRYAHSSWGRDNKLYIFAGCGYDPKGYLRNSRNFKVIDKENYYNNELLCYHLDSHKWENLLCKNDPPSPRAYAAVAVTGNSAWLYGGYINGQVFSDLYELHMKEQTWTQIIVESLSPSGQCAHTLTAATNDYFIAKWFTSGTRRKMRELPI